MSALSVGPVLDVTLAPQHLREVTYSIPLIALTWTLFYQERLIPPNIDIHMKVISSPNEFVLKSAAPGQEAQ